MQLPASETPRARHGKRPRCRRRLPIPDAPVSHPSVKSGQEKLISGRANLHTTRFAEDSGLRPSANEVSREPVGSSVAEALTDAAITPGLAWFVAPASSVFERVAASSRPMKVVVLTPSVRLIIRNRLAAIDSWYMPVPSVRIGRSSPCATKSQRSESSNATSIRYSGMVACPPEGSDQMWDHFAQQRRAKRRGGRLSHHLVYPLAGLHHRDALAHVHHRRAFLFRDAGVGVDACA